MFADIHFIDFLRANPALAVFVTLALGFLVGKLRWRSFSLGTVTSVLLVGVVVGQLKIEIPEPAKTLFFLLFLFSVGYAVGPQFFRGLKRDGLPQVGFAVVVCLLCLGSTWLCATLMGYDVAQAAGLLAGSQTMSAVLGVATDTIRQLPDGQAIDLDAMPVCYAVTYIFGTAGSAWILGTLGPRLLGGGGEGTQGGARSRIEAGRRRQFHGGLRSCGACHRLPRLQGRKRLVRAAAHRRRIRTLHAVAEETDFRRAAASTGAHRRRRDAPHDDLSRRYARGERPPSVCDRGGGLDRYGGRGRGADELLGAEPARGGEQARSGGAGMRAIF